MIWHKSDLYLSSSLQFSLTSAFKGLLKRQVFSSGAPGKEGFYKLVIFSKLLLASMLLFAFGSSHRRFDGSFKYR